MLYVVQVLYWNEMRNTEGWSSYFDQQKILLVLIKVYNYCLLFSYISYLFGFYNILFMSPHLAIEPQQILIIILMLEEKKQITCQG